MVELVGWWLVRLVGWSVGWLVVKVRSAAGILDLAG